MELVPFEKGTEAFNTFVKWRGEQLTGFVENLSRKFRERFPVRTLTLAALPPDMMASHAQPWDVWLEKEYLDAALPMLYGDANFEARVKKIALFPRKERIFCGLDAHGLPPETVLKQIAHLRNQGAGGCVIWYSGQVEDDLPLLRIGPFSNPAMSPLSYHGVHDSNAP